MAAIQLVYGSVKASTLRSVLTDAREIVVVSAYTTLKGFSEVSKQLLDCIRSNGTVTLLIGIDRAGVTSSELVRALGQLLKKGGERVRVFVLVESGRSFLHAKVFAARKKGTADVLIGSFNLTGSGLSTNHELAARLTGSASGIFDELGAFVNSIPGTQELTIHNVDHVAKALTTSPTIPADREATESRRREVVARLKKLIDALQGPAVNVLEPAQSSMCLRRLLAEGGFCSYQFDIEKLSISLPLTWIYEQRLILRERTTDAGTAKVNANSAISARLQLLPAHLQARFSTLAKRMGKAFRACGFETPFGFWIPHVYLKRLGTIIAEIARRLPDQDALEAAIRANVTEHKEKLAGTVASVLDRAIKGGLQHPREWRDRLNPALRELKDKWVATPESAWGTSEGYAETLAFIRTRLLAIDAKLSPDLPIAKLQRIRPELVPVPVALDDASIRRLLEAMTWSVAEDQGQRNTKPAVRALARHTSGKAPSLATLHALSDALLEGVDGAESLFFATFGAPPYWDDELRRRSVDDLFGPDAEGDDSE